MKSEFLVRAYRRLPSERLKWTYWVTETKPWGAVSIYPVWYREAKGLGVKIQYDKAAA